MYRLLLVFIAWVAAGTVAADAQPATPLTPPEAGGNSAATPVPTPDKGITAPTGVIRPGNPDPSMAVTPPSTGVTPVIPPPGTAGNNPAVIPK